VLPPKVSEQLRKIYETQAEAMKEPKFLDRLMEQAGEEFDKFGEVLPKTREAIQTVKGSALAVPKFEAQQARTEQHAAIKFLDAASESIEASKSARVRNAQDQQKEFARVAEDQEYIQKLKQAVFAGDLTADQVSHFPKESKIPGWKIATAAELAAIINSRVDKVSGVAIPIQGNQSAQEANEMIKQAAEVFAQ